MLTGRVVESVADDPIKRMEELLPWNVAASLSPRNRQSGVNEDAATKVGVGSSSELRHIWRTDRSDGEITVGTLVPVGRAAIATDGHNTLAMLETPQAEP